MSAPSFQDYFNAGRAEAISRRPDLTFDAGDISEFYVAAMAAMADQLTGYFAGRFNATYLDGASGDDLTTLADDHWNIQRIAATFASGNVRFTRTGGGAAGTLPAGFVVATQKDANGKEFQYALNADLNWGLGSNGPYDVAVTATVTGTDSNADLNKVNRTITVPFDPLIVVTNSLSRMAGGAPAETDAALRERVRLFPSTVRRGTLAALEYGAKTVAGVAKASALEEIDITSAPTGIVDLYVTDSSGNSSTTMINNVTTEIKNWRAAGTVVNVLGGLIQTQDVTMTLTVRAGTNTAALISNVQAAVIARVNKLKIGETLYKYMIQQAVLNVDESIVKADVTVPAGDALGVAGYLIKAGTVTVA